MYYECVAKRTDYARRTAVLLKELILRMYDECVAKIIDITHLGRTRRVPVQRAVERDEIPYPYKVHDTTLRPHNYKIDLSRA